MAALASFLQGESITIGFILPIDYDLNNIDDIKVYLGAKSFQYEIVDSTIKCSIKSDETKNLLGNQNLVFWLDDKIFGVKKKLVGVIEFNVTNAISTNESVNTEYDIIVTLEITETAIEVGDVLYDYIKGDVGKSAYQSYVDTTTDDPILTEEEWSSVNDMALYVKKIEPNLRFNADGTIEWGQGGDTGILTWDAFSAKIRSVDGKKLKIGAGSGDTFTMDIDQRVVIGEGANNGIDKLQVEGTIKSEEAVNSNNNPILGQLYPTDKRWCIFGDSMSNDVSNNGSGDYPSLVIDKIKFKNTAVNAVAGNTISQQLAVLKALILNDADYLLDYGIVSLHIGVNDFVANTVLGDINSVVGANSYCGKLKDFIETAFTANPEIDLYIITPMEANGGGVTYKSTNTAGWTLKDLSIKISEICALYSVKCVDLYNKSQFNLETITTYTYDGLHPVGEGSKKIADIVANAFISSKGDLISIQSETDPTVPSWAKEPTKPTYNKNDVGLGNVDNTSDLNKPISTATQAALDLKQTVFTGICQQQYLTENDIVIDNVNRTLTIATVKNGTAITNLNPICFYTDGNGIAVKHILTTPQSVSFAGLVGTLNTGVWYFYFTNLGVLVASKTAWTNFDLIAPIFRLYWNEETAFVALNPAQDKDVIHSVEYHKNDISWADHAWKHSEGTRWINGFEISHNRLASGSPNANGSNSVVALSTGTNLDDNLFYTVSNVANPTAKFTQNLGSGTLPATSGRFIPTYNLTAADLRKLPATEYPFVFDNNNVPCYITANGVITPVTNNYYFVYYLYALQDERVGEAVKIRSAEVQFSTPTLAAAHSWEQLQTTFPTLKDPEIRILYKLTFEHRSTYNVAVAKESVLRVVDDLRKQKTTTTATAGGTLPATSITEVTDGNVQTAIDNVRLSITSLKKVCSVQVLSGTSSWSIANGKAYIRIPSVLNGMNLVMCGMSVVTKSSSGTPTVQLSRGRQATATDDFTFVSMLSTPLTIDANEYDSKDATAYVIDTTKDDVATGDVIRVDLTAIGTGTKGLNLTLTFSL